MQNHDLELPFQSDMTIIVSLRYQIDHIEPYKIFNTKYTSMTWSAILVRHDHDYQSQVANRSYWTSQQFSIIIPPRQSHPVGCGLQVTIRRGGTRPTSMSTCYTINYLERCTIVQYVDDYRLINKLMQWHHIRTCIIVRKFFRIQFNIFKLPPLLLKIIIKHPRTSY